MLSTEGGSLNEQGAIISANYRDGVIREDLPSRGINAGALACLGWPKENKRTVIDDYSGTMHHQAAAMCK